jgi:hypothetical protein
MQMTYSEFDTQFFRLTLELDKHIDGYIDAYGGPADLKTAVSATPKRTPAQLRDDVARLETLIPQEDAARVAYLTAVLRAMRCSIQIIAGKAVAYLDEVAQTFDITPALVDESLFLAEHKELDLLLPGSGTIPERMEARRQRYNLPSEKVLPLLELARNETRQRTIAYLQAQFGSRYTLPDNEDVEVTLTSDQPWSAYNWYKGNGRSHIEFNTDIPVSALNILGTFAHEGYPGHHTEGVLKEKYLLQQRGYAEQAVALLHSPSAVIAEGIATTAVDIIFPNNTQYDWLVEVLLPAAGIETGETAAQMRRLAEANKYGRYVSGNAAILYHTGQLTADQAVEYIQTYGLSSRPRAVQSFRFLTHPLFRSYTFTYTQGRALLQQAAAANNNLEEIFGRLLTEQILPSHLTDTQVFQ